MLTVTPLTARNDPTAFNDGCHRSRFATAVVTTFFAPTNYLTLCNAGHPLPLLYRAKARRWSFLENTTESRSKKVANIPLGIADIADYEQFTTRLNVGDLVMCYSDSLIESHSSSGEMLGQRGLLALANDIDVAEPPRAIANLLSRIKSLAVENLKGDDVTVLLFRVNGSAVRVSLAGKVMGSLRVLRGLIGSILPRGGPAPLPDLSLANLGGALFDRLNRLWRGPK